MGERRFTDEEIIRIYNEEYIGKHMGGPALAKKYRYRFYEDFYRLKLNIRNNQEKSRQYTCDVDYFKYINTEEKAYWLGFIFADGYIQHPSKSNTVKFGICLKESDSEHLEKLKKAINFTGEIRHYTVRQGYKVGAGYCRLIVSNNQFAQNLINHGCVEQKSNIIMPPIDVPEELEKHFIRGFIDGNGSITVSNNKKKCIGYTIKTCSTKELLEWIQNNLLKNKIIEHKYHYRKRKPEHIVTSFEIGGNYNVKRCLDYLYKDATIWLDRKHNRYVDLCNLINKRESEKIGNKCDICGIRTSNRYTRWNNDDQYHGMVLCFKHYQQLRKYKRIIPDRKPYCEICGDSYGRTILVGDRYPKYLGVTMCRKHYEQVTNCGYPTDNEPGRHKC